ncbi:MAG: hypothetical protein LKKZDAJK_002778 [Candidatus Fervidibacter sp.]|mgnify:FL=1
MRRWLTFLLLVAAPIAGWGWGEREQGLWRLLQPPHFRTLQGTLQVSVFSERMGDRVWTISLWADERRSRTQLMLPHPEGARQIITITTPEGMWVFLPFAKRAIRQVGMNFPSWRDLWGFRSDKLDLAQRNYDLRFVGRDKVADLPCLVVELVPKFKENPKRRLWIHPPTRLPLRLERYDPDGKLRVRISFTEVQIDRPLPLLIFDTNPPPDWQWEEVSVQRQPLRALDAPQVLGFSLLLPTWVPPGYVLDGLFALQDRRFKVAHIVYTDGISVISLFEHPVPKERSRGEGQAGSEREGRRSKMGLPPPMVRMFPQQWLRRDIAGIRIVLVGETSKEWLERIADSLTSQVASGR